MTPPQMTILKRHPKFAGGARGLMADWNLSSDARVHVAMLSTPAWTPDEVFANTEKEFSNGANLVVHTEGTDYGGEPVKVHKSGS